MPRMRLLWPCVIAGLAALAVTAARGQQDLDAGKTGPQLYAQDCAACHRSPRGLARNMGGGSLASFLRQHYTSSAASANAVAGYVLSAGGADRQKGDAKQGLQDRAKGLRPSEPIPSGQPGAQAPKQRDQLARPSDATVDQHGRPAKKSRRHAPAEPAPAGAAAGPDASKAQAETRGAAAAQPGFTEPLP